LDGSEPTPVLLRGQIVFDESTPSFTGATLYVYLQDTSLADADAVNVAQQVTRGVSYDERARNAVPFVVGGVVPDERAHYTVMVLVDLDGDGRVSHGDFINVESYPVLTWGRAREVSIRVERVG